MRKLLRKTIAVALFVSPTLALGQGALNINVDEVMGQEGRTLYAKDPTQMTFADHWIMSKVPSLKLGKVTSIQTSDLYRVATNAVNSKWDVALDNLERILVHETRLPKDSAIELLAIQAYLLNKMGMVNLASIKAVTVLASADQLSPEGITVMTSVLTRSPSDIWLPSLANVTSEDVLKGRLKLIRHYLTAKKGELILSDAEHDNIRQFPTHGVQLGINAFNQQKYQVALNAFQMVRKMNLAPKHDKQLALVNIARTLYEAGYIKESAMLYSKIEPNSLHWAQSQEEAAWSYLRTGNYEKALAISRTFSTPFFDARFLPGFDVVKTACHLKRCEFLSAASQIQKFKKSYMEFATWYERGGIRLQEKDWSNWFIHRKKTKPSLSEEYGKKLRGEMEINPPIVALKKRRQSLLAERAKIEGYYKVSAALPLPAVGLRDYYLGYKKDVNDLIEETEKSIGQEIRTRTGELFAELKVSVEILLLLDFEIMDHLRKILAKNEELGVQSKKISFSQREEKWPFEAEIWIDELTQYKERENRLCGKSM